MVRAFFSKRVLCRVEDSLQGDVGNDTDPASILDVAGTGGARSFEDWELVFDIIRHLFEGCKLGLTLGGDSTVGVQGTPSTRPATPPNGSEKLRWKLNLSASRLC